MTVTRNQARILGTVSICGVLLLQALNGLVCYKQDLRTLLSSTTDFVALPLLPAIVSLAPAESASGSGILRAVRSLGF